MFFFLPTRKIQNNNAEISFLFFGQITLIFLKHSAHLSVCEMQKGHGTL